MLLTRRPIKINQTNLTHEMIWMDINKKAKIYKNHQRSKKAAQVRSIGDYNICMHGTPITVKVVVLHSKRVSQAHSQPLHSLRAWYKHHKNIQCACHINRHNGVFFLKTEHRAAIQLNQQHLVFKMLLYI